MKGSGRRKKKSGRKGIRWRETSEKLQGIWKEEEGI